MIWRSADLLSGFNPKRQKPLNTDQDELRLLGCARVQGAAWALAVQQPCPSEQWCWLVMRW